MKSTEMCYSVQSCYSLCVQGKIGATAQHDQHTPNNSLAKRHTTGTTAETATAFKSDFANDSFKTLKNI